MTKQILCLSLLLMANTVWAAPLGGYMSDNGCYMGRTIPNRTCATAQGEDSFGPMKVFAQAGAMYVDSESRVRATGEIWINDYSDFFAPEGQVPVLVRGIICSVHRSCSYKVISMPLVFNRVSGERTFRAVFGLEMHNNFGAEYAELLEKLEVLVPGVNHTFVVRF